MRTYIAELKEGDLVDDVFAIADISRGTTKRGTPYRRLSFSDKTGTIPGIQWDACDKAFGSGEAVYVVGTVDTYRGEIQIKVKEMSHADASPHIQDLVESADTNEVTGAEERLNALRLEVRSPTLTAILDIALDNQGALDKMKVAPAAVKIHHTRAGDLLIHTVEVAEIAKSAAEIVGADVDLVVAGAILHDLSKIHTLDNSGLVTKRTKKGILLEHTFIGAHSVLSISESARDRVSEYSHEEVLRLTHLILSHHGKREWGAPVAPAMIEAEILHHADAISSRVSIFKTAQEEAPREEESVYCPPMGRTLYVPAIKDIN